MHVLTPLEFDASAKVLTCQQAHVLRTRHWTGNNLWSQHPVLEAQVLDMNDQQWPQLEALLHALLEAVALPNRFCQCWPGINGRGTVVLEASEAALGRCILQQALELLALPPIEYAKQWAGALSRIRHVMDEECLGPSTACIAHAALQRHLPAYRLFSKGNLVQLGMGAAQQRIWAAESDLTGAIAQDIAANKALTKQLLAHAGIPTPQGDIARSPAHAWQIAQGLGVPVVVKPLDGNRARGVSLDLMDQAAVETAWQLAKREGTQVLVERCIRGSEHRVLVVGDAVVAATRGETLEVVGDGHSNITQLVETQINQHSRCLVDNTLERIELASNAKVQGELLRQQLDVQSIPADGQHVVLLRTGNLTVDCTDEVHPDIAAHAVMAARTIGLDIAGIDMVVQDIRQPLRLWKSMLALACSCTSTPYTAMHALWAKPFAPTSSRIRMTGRFLWQACWPARRLACASPAPWACGCRRKATTQALPAATKSPCKADYHCRRRTKLLRRGNVCSCTALSPLP